MDDRQVALEIRTAIKEGDRKKVSALLDADRRRLTIMTPFGTWLHVAAAHGKLDIVKLLVARGANVNANGGIAGGAPLSLAASKGYDDIVRFLLSHGANLDITEPERNPLFSAIYGGHLATAKLLVEMGIDIHKRYTGKSMKDMDALAFAKERGQTEIAKFLRERS